MMIDLKTKDKSKAAFKNARRALVADVHTIRNVFISGSMSIDKLPEEATVKLDSIIEKGMNILIGDARGVDLLVQKYLQEKNYSNVTVYYNGKGVRNNIGSWKTKFIEAKFTMRHLFYVEKDKAMVADTDCGLMIWDGKSRGTLNNIKMMHAVQKKFCVIWNGNILTNNNIDIILSSSNTNKKQSQLKLF